MNYPISYRISVTAVIAVLWLSLTTALLPHLPVPLRLCASIMYIALLSYCLGQRLARQAHELVAWILGLSVLVALLGTTATLLFYFSPVTGVTLKALLILSPLILVRSTPFTLSGFVMPALRFVRSRNLYLTLYCLLIVTLALIFIKSQTTVSVVSPWIVTNPAVFVLFFLLLLTAVLMVSSPERTNAGIWPPVFMIALSVAAITFVLGFGYDTFIHEASIKLIETTGTLVPKTPYYVGYYMLVLFVRTLTGLSVASVNTWITPVLTALLLPAALYASFRYMVAERYYAALVPVFFLIVPYPELVQSTPQALSFVFSALTLLFAWIRLSAPITSWWSVLILAAFATALHPLTGVPVALAVISAWIWSTRKYGIRYRSISVFAISALISVCVPLLLMLAGSWSSEFSVHFGYQGIAGLIGDLAGPLYRFASLDDLIYSYAGASTFLLFILLICGVYGLKKFRSGDTWLSLFLAGCALFISYALTRTLLRFDFATSGEQHIFADRLLTLTKYFFLPVICYGGYILLKAAKRTNESRILLALILSLCATGAWYLSYPRFDTHAQNKGYTASAADIEAVRWIHDDAGDADYVVLANQTVSAVAIKEFGFERYYRGLFYYPVPTNGPLYALYLDITNNPDNVIETVRSVSERTGVKRVYMVLNGYWESYEKIDTLLRRQSDRAVAFGDQHVTVYRFDIE